MEKINKIFCYYILFLFVFLVSCFIFISYPHIYNLFYGRTIVNQHISEVIGNKTNDTEVVSLILNWIKLNVHYPREEESIKFLNKNCGLYKIDNQTRLFFRDVPASWTIKSKLGKCGEISRYFVEIMNKLGYKTRMVKPDKWDHKWAEYFTRDGTKKWINPSESEIIENPVKFVEGMNFTNIWAIDLKGNKENVTEDYI